MLPPPEPAAAREASKVITNLSVPQLAFFIRLLNKAGFFASKNQLQLVTFFSKHFGSVKSEDISSESLRTKYYNIDKGTVSSVESLLTKAIEYIKKGNWLLIYAINDLINSSVDLAIKQNIF